jgi:transcriptional regulator NrdR family protein
MTRERENLVIRRRCCDDCKHRFFTAQEPEYLIRRELIKWSDSPFELKINERPDH